jgi:hypothetical protein
MATMTHINNAGWHCSYCMKVEDIARKIESFSHQEINKVRHKNVTNINNKIQNFQYIFNNEFRVIPYNCEIHGLPDCPNCNYEESYYSILKVKNSFCSEIFYYDKYIHLEYRSNTTNDSKQLFPKDKYQIYELKDIKDVGFHLAKNAAMKVLRKQVQEQDNMMTTPNRFRKFRKKNYEDLDMDSIRRGKNKTDFNH